jgi:hypothetical protein
MSEKTAKPRKAKAKTGKDEAGVLGNLPATRTTRVGGERSRGAATKPRAAAKPKAAAPSAAAKVTPKAATRTPRPRTAPGPTPVPPHGPQPVRAGSPALKESTERARSESSERLEHGSSPPTGTELVTTAIQAAGELAQIGLTVGGQVLKRAVKRLPRP